MNNFVVNNAIVTEKHLQNYIFSVLVQVCSLRIDVRTTFIKSLKALVHSRFFFYFMASFSYAFFDILSVSEDDFSSKTQIFTFEHCFKDDILNPKWENHFVRNDLQLRPTVPEIKYTWFSVFLLSVANLKKNIFPPIIICMKIETTPGIYRLYTVKKGFLLLR